MSYISGRGGVTSTDATDQPVDQAQQAWQGVAGRGGRGRSFVPDLYPRRPLGQRLTDRHKVTGFIYTGTPAVTAEVTGYPIYRGYTGHQITVVSLLTDDGRIVNGVRVSTEVMDDIRVRDLGGIAVDALWKIADKGLFGRAGHALAELARREREQLAVRRAKDAAWSAKMRADGDRLKAGAR